MIHEILLALLGCPGDVIQMTSSGQFRVKPSVTFLSEGEKDLIERIVEIATFYVRILKFVQEVDRTNIKLALRLAAYEIIETGIDLPPFPKNLSKVSEFKLDQEAAGPSLSRRTPATAPGENQTRFTIDVFAGQNAAGLHNSGSIDGNQRGAISPDFNEIDSENPSAYVKAFAYSASKVLQKYRYKVCMLEQQYLSEHSLSYYDMIERLSEESQTLPSLYSMILEIEEDELKGGALIDAVNEKARSGNPLVSNMMHEILNDINQVFFMQLRAWIIYGTLSDFGDEFFINRVCSEENVDRGTSPHGGGDTFSEIDGTRLSVKTDATNVKEKFQNLLVEMTKQDSERDALYEWSSAYTVRLTMLPSKYISAIIAEKILFLGKAVRVLQHESTLPEDRIPTEELEQMSQALVRLEHVRPFRPQLFAEVIEVLRETVASRLWHLIVVKGDLRRYFEFFRNFFLFGKGEFYQIFLEEAAQFFDAPPAASAAYDLNHGPLQSALLSLRLDQDEIARSLQFTIRSYGFDKRNMTSVDGLSLLGNVQHNSLKGVVTLHSNSTLTKPANSAVWHSFKQKVDYGFKVNFRFTVRMQRAQTGSTRYSRQDYRSESQSQVQGTPARSSWLYNDPRSNMAQLGGDLVVYDEQGRISTQPSAFVFTFILQNENDINSWKIAAPKSRRQIVEYLAIELRCILSQSSGGQRLRTPAQSGHRQSLAVPSQQLTERTLNNSIISGVGSQGGIRILSTIVSVHCSKPTTLHRLKELITGKEGLPGREDRVSHQSVGGGQNPREEGQPMGGIRSTQELLNNVVRNKAKQEQCIFEQCIDSSILSGGDVKVRFEYLSQEKLLLICVNESKIKVPDISLANFIKLDNGTCYVGLAQESENSRNIIELKSWDFVSAFSNKLSHDSTLYSTRADNWSGLCLQCKLKWPMHLIFSEEIIEKYNTLFRYLFPIKRLQMALQNVWKLHIRLFTRSQDPLLRELMHLRSNLSFLVNNLVGYLQLDVLEAQFKKLKDYLLTAHDFQNVRAMHDKYLSNISHQFFILNPKIIELLHSLFMIGKHVCVLVQEAAHEAEIYFQNIAEHTVRRSQKIEWESRILDQFQRVKGDYENISNMTFKVLSSQKVYESQPELAQLLTRIDFNQFFSLNMYRDF